MDFKIGDRVVFKDIEYFKLNGKFATVELIPFSADGKSRVKVRFDGGERATIWYSKRFRKLTKLEQVLK